MQKLNPQNHQTSWDVEESNHYVRIKDDRKQEKTEDKTCKNKDK